MSKEITARETDYSQWYNDLVIKAGLADYSAVRGCMVIKPYGFALWENMQSQLDKRFKETGHQNAYFPLFIPKSFLSKEAAHVEGFAKECAVVTHYRLKNSEDGTGIIVDPDAKLEEELIVRPTSETIIWNTYKTWIQSYRDLPLLINQWANVVRWEMRTRLFLRTTEFLWQEGHTAHATAAEAMHESRMILDLYANFAEEYLAMPVIKGEKTASERFPGADNTFTIEAMMQDKKALQAGTSHFLGQHFSRSFEIKYLSAEGREEFVWTTSWGVSTRMIGGLIMTHSDDNGMVMPPRIAPIHVVILPVIHKEEDRENILAYCEQLAKEIRAQRYHERRIEVEIDKRELPGGEKGWSWVKKGVPIRLEIGNKECQANSVFMGRRDKEYKERVSIPKEQFINNLQKELDEMQTSLYQRAVNFRKQNSTIIKSKEEFYAFFKGDGGFAYVHWQEDPDLEAKLKQELSVTIRCIPFDAPEPKGNCIFSGKPDCPMVIFAKAY